MTMSSRGRRPSTSRTIPAVASMSSRPVDVLLLLLLLLLLSSASSPAASAWTWSSSSSSSSPPHSRPPGSGTVGSPVRRSATAPHDRDRDGDRDRDDGGPAPRRTASSASGPLSLSSAYDPALPASLVGEAVRSALRSDRGTCLDFSRDRYRRGGVGAAGRSVSVVGMRGRGTMAFLDAKFSGRVPRFDDDDGGGGGGPQASSSSSPPPPPMGRLVRRGRAFETAYLTARGRIVDRLLVLCFPPSSHSDGAGTTTTTTATAAAGGGEDAFLITSPGNDGAGLYDRLSPTIFPMDGVTLSICACPDATSVLTIACSTLGGARRSFEDNVWRMLTGNDDGSQSDFPEDGMCNHYRVPSSSSGGVGGGGGSAFTDVFVVRHTFLPPEICHGYTLLFRDGGGGGGGGGGVALADEVWRHLTDEYNDRGPVGIGALEYDTLRVEAGQPGYGSEMTGDGPTRKMGIAAAAADDDDDADGEDEDEGAASYCAKSNPLELHLRGLIDVDKGCYQGQEGVASVLKNKRGPPRQLYQVVFLDSENDFDGRDAGFGLLSTDNKALAELRKLKMGRGAGTAALANDTRRPRPGDDVYVLGSNESIPVGKISECFLQPPSPLVCSSPSDVLSFFPDRFDGNKYIFLSFLPLPRPYSSLHIYDSERGRTERERGREDDRVGAGQEARADTERHQGAGSGIAQVVGGRRGRRPSGGGFRRRGRRSRRRREEWRHREREGWERHHAPPPPGSVAQPRGRDRWVLHRREVGVGAREEVRRREIESRQRRRRAPAGLRNEGRGCGRRGRRRACWIFPIRLPGR